MNSGPMAPGSRGPGVEIPLQLRGRPFSWDEAQQAGLTRHQLRTSAFRHVFREVWVPADVPDGRDCRLAATKLVTPPHAVLRGLTAAWIYGADVRQESDLDVDVGYPPGKRRRKRPGVQVGEEALAPSDIWVVEGSAVTSPVRTSFDCLRLLPDPMGLVVADALTHLGCTSIEEIASYFAGQRRLRNLRIGERLVPDIEPATESPRETRTRVRMVRIGLPRPVAQFVVHDFAGAFVARLDFAYPEVKVAIEYDGAWHWEHHLDDERRRARLRELGWTVIVITARDLYGDEWLGRVARALRKAAA